MKNSAVKKMLPIIILQIVSVVFIIALILCVKLLKKENFRQIEEKYNKNFNVETNIESVTGDEPEVAKSIAVIKEINLEVSQKGNNSFAIPVIGQITSSFGYRDDPFTKEYKKHKGTDIAAPKNTEIIAAADGEVAYVGFDENGYGNYLTINHGERVKTLYGHCNEILVSNGQKIKKGEVIAKVGSTGKSTGNHLHFEIRINGVPVNPQWYVNLEQVNR